MVKPLDPKTIPKYVNELVRPPVFKPTVATDTSTGEVLSHNYTVFITNSSAVSAGNACAWLRGYYRR